MTRAGTLHHPAITTFAIGVGVLCHLFFAAAVLIMMGSIWSGLEYSAGRFSGARAVVTDIILLLQFPVLHSWLLTARGRKLLLSLSPEVVARQMTTTWFSLIASVQLIITFGFWSPSHLFVYQFEGSLRVVSLLAYLSAWGFLLKTMIDADLTLQTGLKGWFAVARGREPKFNAFPQHGTFRFCRQPIYLAFALILWTAPVWTVDRLILTVLWTTYCVFGPLLKEKRYIQRYGAAFREYQQHTDYMIPLNWSFRKKRVSGNCEDRI